MQSGNTAQASAPESAATVRVATGLPAQRQTAAEADSEDKTRWYVLRDLKRANARERAYKVLGEAGFEVFAPLVWRLSVRGGRRIRQQVPAISDLLFVRALREDLDPVVESTATLQYRYLRGTFREPMTVRDKDMDAFIRAVNSSEKPRYYSPEELTPAMCGKRIRIVGGGLDGMEGCLLKLRGSSVKRILVELPGILAAGVEVSPEFIVFV